MRRCAPAATCKPQTAGRLDCLEFFGQQLVSTGRCEETSLKIKSQRDFWSGLMFLVVGGVFVIEAVSVILQVLSFKLTGKRFFVMSPLHHHFELTGWKETTVIVRFWILSIIFTLLGLATLKLR